MDGWPLLLASKCHFSIYCIQDLQLKNENDIYVFCIDERLRSRVGIYSILFNHFKWNKKIVIFCPVDISHNHNHRTIQTNGSHNYSHNHKSIQINGSHNDSHYSNNHRSIQTNDGSTSCSVLCRLMMVVQVILFYSVLKSRMLLDIWMIELEFCPEKSYDIHAFCKYICCFIYFS